VGAAMESPLLELTPPGAGGPLGLARARLRPGGHFFGQWRLPGPMAFFRPGEPFKAMGEPLGQAKKKGGRLGPARPARRRAARRPKWPKAAKGSKIPSFLKWRGDYDRI
jgi:hypothetical protein